MATENLEVVISARDQFTATANRIIGTLGRMQGAASRVGRGVGQMGMGLARVGLIAAGAAATGLTAVAKAAINWEDALAGVNKTMDLTPGELQEIGDAIRKLSTEIPLGAEAIAGLVEQAGALGIAKKDVVEFARVAATIGVTTNVSADQAATSLGVMSNLLGLTGKDFERFASTLVDLGNKGASTEDQILAIAERAAGAGATIGLAAQDVLGFASAVANLGIEPEAGGSSLQRFFIDTLKFTAAAGEDLKTLAATAGMTGEAFTTAFKKDAAGALEAFVTGLSKLDEEKRIGILDALGWDDIRVGRMFLGLAEAEAKTKNLSKSLDIATAAWSANTAAAEEADKRYATVRSKLTLLWNQFLDGARVIGMGFLPALGRLSDKLKKGLADEKVRADLKQFGEDIGRFMDGINWDEVVSQGRSFVALLRDAAGYAKTVFDAFNALPQDLKAGILAFAAVDKLSGGLVHQGLGNIVGGLGESIARSIGSQLPGVGKLFVQPVLVTNWPAGFGPTGPLVPPGATPAAPGGAITPKVGAAIAIDMGWINQLVKDKTGTTLAEKIGDVRDGTDDMKYALVSAEQRTENLLRQNLSRPLPTPNVNVTVNVSGRDVSTSVSQSEVYGPTSSSYYGGSTKPALSW